MADGPEIAQAYVTLTPTMPGIASTITREVGGAAATGAAAKAGAKAGKVWGARFATAGKIATVGLTAPLLAVGAVALQAGMKVDEAYDTIRTGTGATGKTLEGLQSVFRDVARKTPADMDKVSATVADLNTRLGLTGPTLNKLSQQILEAGRMGGVDVDVQKITGAFSVFGVKGADTTKRMDDIFRVSQATGVGINDLAGIMSKSGGVLKELGFGFTETASLLGVLDKAGINSRAVTSSMQAGLVKLAKDGEKPADAFKRVTGDLQSFVAQGKDAKALELAGEIFGTRGAGQFIAALKSGKVNLDDLAGAAGLSKDTILGVAQETKDFPELWKEFQNSATLALAPVGQKLMPMIGDAITALAPHLERFANWMSGLSSGDFKVILGVGGALVALGPTLWLTSKAMAAYSTISGIASGVQQAFAKQAVGTRIQLAALAVQQRLSSAATVIWSTTTKIAAVVARGMGIALRFMMGPIGLIITAIGLLVAGLLYFFTKTTVGKKIVAVAWAGIQAAVSGVVEWWTKTAWPAIKRFFSGINRVVANVVNWIKKNWPLLLAIITGPIGLATLFVIRNWGKIKTATVQAWNTVKAKITSVWRAVWEFLKKVWGWIDLQVFAKFRFALVVWRLAFKLAKDKVTGFFSDVWTSLKRTWGWIDDNVFAKFRLALVIWRLAFKLAKDKVTGFFSGIWTSMKNTWDNIKTKVFDVFKSALGSLREKFRTVKDGIGKVWDGLKAKASKPIEFIINTVYNNGIRKWWNTIADKLGIKNKLPELVMKKAYARGGIENHTAQIARAGAMRLWAEPETGGEAYIPLAHGKRGRSTAILSEVANRFGYGLTRFADGGFWGAIKDLGGDIWDGVKSLGRGLKDLITDPTGTITRVAGKLVSGLMGGRSGGLYDLFGGLPKMAVQGLASAARNIFDNAGTQPGISGGGKPISGNAMGWQNQWNILRSAFPGATLTSAFRPGAITAVGTPSYHGQGRAIDVTPSMAIFNWIARHFPNATELIYSPAGGRQLWNGRPYLFGEPTRGDHWDHVHWAMRHGGIIPGTYDKGGWLPPGGVGMNLTGRPEAVLSPAQSEALVSGRGQRPVQLTFNTTRVAPRDVIYAQRLADLLDAGVSA